MIHKLVRNVKWSVIKLIHTSAFTSNNEKTVKFIKKIVDSDLKFLLEENKDKILYSSFVESTYLKLGYARNKILENKYLSNNQQKKIEEANVKPFPSALKYIYGENPDDLFRNKKAEDLATLELEDANTNIILPFSKVTESGSHKKISEDTSRTETSSWMHDYEYYDESAEEQSDSIYGTPNPKIPISKVPCGGCGALLHCAEPSLPGYLPSELYCGRSIDELKTIICQRCHFLKNYNVSIDVTVKANEYVELISSIKDKFALVILMVDLLDFPCSIWNGIADILGDKRPVIVVGNKVDLLPKDSKGYLNHIRKSLHQNIIDCGFTKTNIKHVSLISATTGYGVEELITQLHNIWGSKGDVYLLGCTNVGKSSLFNTLLHSDYCKVQATDIIQRATTCPWPGTTLRILKFPILRPSDHRLFLRTQRLINDQAQNRGEAQLRRIQANATGKIKHATLIGHIGRTFESKEGESPDQFSMTHNSGFNPKILTVNEKGKEFKESKWCYDTPGVVQPDQILNILTTEELILTIPKEMIRPRTFLMKRGMTLFLAGLGRLDYVSGLESIRVTVFASQSLPIVICYTNHSEEIYETFLGSELLGVPMGSEERFIEWPNLETTDEIVVEGIEKHISCADILLSSAGWLGINLPSQATGVFRAWTPEKRGIKVRIPALIPNALVLRGTRIRGSLAYRTSKAFKKQ